MAESRNAGRPLSPHLQVYKKSLTMTLSIVHRITGVALYAGTLLLVWWLTAAATSDPYFDLVQSVFGSVLGKLVLFGFTWALIHHALGGVRHLIWDTLRGFEPADREFLTLASLIGSIALTFIIWAVGYLAMGGPR